MVVELGVSLSELVARGIVLARVGEALSKVVQGVNLDGFYTAEDGRRRRKAEGGSGRLCRGVCSKRSTRAQETLGATGSA